MIYSWFTLALLAPFLWGVVNHADRFLLSKCSDKSGVGSILIFSSVFSIFLVIFIPLFLHVNLFHLPFHDKFSLMLIGGISVLAFYFYLSALENEETSVVIPFLQLGPIFGYLLSYLVLNETLTLQQLLASILILAGIGILSFDFDIDNKIKFKKEMLLLMVGSAFFFALHDTLFKSIAITRSFWVASFWQYLGITVVGVCIFVFSERFRKQFLHTFNRSNGTVVAVNFASELLYIVGNLASNFAMMLAPVALVLVVSSYQPLFVFVIGTILTLLFPHIVSEKITKKHIVQKIISIVIVVIGSYLLYSASV
jgi:drug/metabolite transporter (DMT)-like permease